MEQRATRHDVIYGAVVSRYHWEVVYVDRTLWLRSCSARKDTLFFHSALPTRDTTVGPTQRVLSAAAESRARVTVNHTYAGAAPPRDPWLPLSRGRPCSSRVPLPSSS